MNDSNVLDIPKVYKALQDTSSAIGFTMPSDVYVGTFLKTLVSSKPWGRFLELGTGVGLSLSWMIDGLVGESELISVDNDSQLIEIARSFFGNDDRVTLVCEDGARWIENYRGEKFDLIFADAWPGKYGQLEETLALLKVGGFYVIDDMLAQANWPEGHDKNVAELLAHLESRDDLNLTKINWSTGIVLAVKTI
ncbi:MULTISPECIES: O-methyltransferase [Maribacter]|uniref:Class I SAM-dependent methyltransferase n=1 Tax=Maribacter flavus TaxID=1658664 RepID=A0ABU7IJ60_9FLAO|nr:MULTISPECIES: class I SAM-dependent methyltransferase [Maribacter]MDC6405880.1 class I SAM-dependent methyltransferase [Maribacter sp. PR66]MEE1972868.1 class I SAM-dependent methyltransferase [Maribacter flavus]